MNCVVYLDSINTIPKAAFRFLICRLSDAKMAEVTTAIRKALDLG